MKKNESLFAFLSVLFSSLCLLTLGACGLQVVPAQDTGPGQSLDEAQKMISASTVTCKDAANCPAASGMITLISYNPSASASEDKGYQWGQCSGFLVADDLMATNSHCIPNELKTAGSVCKDRIHVWFPQTPNFPSEDLNCDQVLLASDISNEPEGEIRADFAFFRLEHSAGRGFYPISRLGISDSMPLQIARVDPQSSLSPTGSLWVQSCNSVQGTIFGNFFQDLSPIVTLGPCKVIHGNSGSAVFDSDGAVRAIVQWTIDNAVVKSLLDFAHVKYLQADHSMVAIGANLGCVPDPRNPSMTLPVTCASDFFNSALAKANVEGRSVAAQKIFSSAIEKWQSRQPEDGPISYFEWTLEIQPQSKTLDQPDLGSPSPKCFKSSFLSEASPISMSLPIWDVMAVADTVFRIIPLPHSILGTRQVTITPPLVAFNASSTLQIVTTSQTVTQWSPSGTTAGLSSLGLCSESQP